MTPSAVRDLIASTRKRPGMHAPTPDALATLLFGVLVGAHGDARRVAEAWADRGDARWPACATYGEACDRALRACDALWPPDEAPRCVCGGGAWEGAGVTFNPILCQSGHRCRACGRVGLRVDTATYRTFFLPLEAGAELGEAHYAWLRSEMEPLWNRRRSEIEGARREIGDAVVRVINRALGLPLHQKGYELRDEELRARWGGLYDAWADSPMYRRPPGYERAPVPADVPADLAVFVLQPEGWARAASAAT